MLANQSAAVSQRLLGVEEMKTSRRRPVGSVVSSAGREREVQREIENFLRALSSYPDRFARDPRLSFERHLFSLAARQSAVGEERRRGRVTF
jgi:hypothetical protein